MLPKFKSLDASQFEQKVIGLNSIKNFQSHIEYCSFNYVNFYKIRFVNLKSLNLNYFPLKHKNHFQYPPINIGNENFNSSSKKNNREKLLSQIWKILLKIDLELYFSQSNSEFRK